MTCRVPISRAVQHGFILSGRVQVTKTLLKFPRPLGRVPIVIKSMNKSLSSARSGSSLTHWILYLSLAVSWPLLPVHSASPAQQPVKPGLPSPESEALRAYRVRDFQKVVALLSPQVDKLKRNELILLGNAYSGLKNHKAAIKTFTSLLANQGKDSEVKTLIGREQMRLGLENEALATLKEALNENDKFEPAYLYSAQIYEKRGNKYELRLLYQDLIEKLGEKPQYVLKVCELATLDGHYELAEKSCRRSIQINSKEPLSYVYLGMTLKETGDPKQGQSFIKQAADSFQKSDFAQITYAQFLEDQKNFVTAFSYFKRATLANPQSITAWLGVGRNATEVQKYEVAFDAFQRACRINANQTLPQFRRAASTLRTYGVSKWLDRFESSIENCGK